MYKVICFILIVSSSLLTTSAQACACDDQLTQKTKQFYCAADKLKNTINKLINESRVAVKLPYRNKTLNKSDATCEIYTVAFLLKTELIRYVYHCNKTNAGENTNTKCVNIIDVNITQLLGEVLIYIEIIANTQWQIYDLLGINKYCVKFITKQNLEEYDVTIEFNSNLTVKDITGRNTTYFVWNNKDVYNTTFCFPSLTNFVSSNCMF